MAFVQAQDIARRRASIARHCGGRFLAGVDVHRLARAYTANAVHGASPVAADAQNVAIVQYGNRFGCSTVARRAVDVRVPSTVIGVGITLECHAVRLGCFKYHISACISIIQLEITMAFYTCHVHGRALGRRPYHGHTPAGVVTLAFQGEALRVRGVERHPPARLRAGAENFARLVGITGYLGISAQVGV